MNLILSHLTEKKFDLISLRLLSSSVPSHLMKKNLILFHLMKIKSGSVSFHQKKISSRPDPDPEQDRTRTGNPGPCGQPTWGGGGGESIPTSPNSNFHFPLSVSLLDHEFEANLQGWVRNR